VPKPSRRRPLAGSTSICRPSDLLTIGITADFFMSPLLTSQEIADALPQHGRVRDTRAF
jgi:hypothetical protein